MDRAAACAWRMPWRPSLLDTVVREEPSAPSSAATGDALSTRGRRPLLQRFDGKAAIAVRELERNAPCDVHHPVRFIVARRIHEQEAAPAFRGLQMRLDHFVRATEPS